VFKVEGKKLDKEGLHQPLFLTFEIIHEHRLAGYNIIIYFRLCWFDPNHFLYLVFSLKPLGWVPK